MTKKQEPDGFKDFISPSFDDRAKAKRRELEKEKNSNFELFSYLEQENNRLDKNALVYFEKFDILKKYPQAQTISKSASVAISDKLVNVKNKFWEENSDFMKSLNEIYNNFFNS